MDLGDSQINLGFLGNKMPRSQNLMKKTKILEKKKPSVGDTGSDVCPACRRPAVSNALTNGWI